MVLPEKSSYRSSSNDPSLQSRLHTLLTNLSDTTKIVKKWPKSENDDASIHYDTTTKLIDSINRVVRSIKDVEEKSLCSPTDLRDKLREYQVPLDLLDLMDYGTPASGNSNNTGDCVWGLNPECFARGLLREGLRQLAGLKRRKLALEMLGRTIQEGMEGIKKGESLEQRAGKKRVRDEDDDDEYNDEDDDDDDDGDEEVVEEFYNPPPTKKAAHRHY